MEWIPQWANMALKQRKWQVFPISFNWAVYLKTFVQNIITSVDPFNESTDHGNLLCSDAKIIFGQAFSTLLDILSPCQTLFPVNNR